MNQADQNQEVILLIERIKTGDSEAFGILQGKYEKALASYVWRSSCNMLSREDIDDILADSWTEVYAALIGTQVNQYNPEKASFYTYLINTARFRILNLLKYNYRNSPLEQRTREDDSSSILDNTAAAEDTEPEYSFIYNEQKRLRQQAYMEMLEIIFLCGGYPHQQFSFMITKLMNGKDSSRATEGKLNLIYDKYSAVPFSSVREILRCWISLHQELGQHMKESILQSMQPVELRLELKVSELMDYDKLSRDFYYGIGNMTVKGSSFQDYYLISKDPAKSKNSQEISNTISNWILKLEERVRSIISADKRKEGYTRNENACSHCKLQKIPPCSKK